MLVSMTGLLLQLAVSKALTEKTDTKIASLIGFDSYMQNHKMTLISVPRGSGKTYAIGAFNQAGVIKLKKSDLSKSYLGKKEPFGKDVRVIIVDDDMDVLELIEFINNKWAILCYSNLPHIVQLYTRSFS
jgi:hypothetical protein